MRKWRRVETAEGLRLVSSLDAHEANLLHNMTMSMQQMLGDRQSSAPSDPLEALTGIRTGNSAPPADATMARLLPDFLSADAPADGAEDRETSNNALRSLHEPEIIDAKITAAQRLLDTLPEGGGHTELSEADAQAWIAAVNDLRLTLGTILKVGPQGPDRLPPKHPMAAHLDVYHWLTALQEFLVLGLMGKPIR